MNLCYIVSQIKTARETIKNREARIKELNDPNYEIKEQTRRQMLYWDNRDIEGLNKRIHELHQSLKDL